jgi:hypothetical protein
MLTTRTRVIAAVLATVFVVALAGVWLATLPRLIMASLQRELSESYGLVLEAQAPRLSYTDGFALTFDDVSLVARGDGRALATSRSARLQLGLASAFGWADTSQTLVLAFPVVDLDVGSSATAIALPANTVEILDGTVRLRDRRLNAVITLSDVSGVLQRVRQDNAKLSLRFILNDSLTTLDAECDDITRLAATGCPADLTLAASGKLLSFSGRAKFKSGLELDGQVTAEADDTGAFFAWLGVPTVSFTQSGRLQLTAGIAASGLATELQRVEGLMANAEMSGSASFKPGPARPMVTADLTLPALNILSSEGVVVARPWRERPWPMADLRVVDARVSLKAAKMIVGGVDLGAADVALTNTNGQAELAVKAPFTAKLLLREEDKLLQWSLDLASKDTSRLLHGFLGLDDLQGDVDVSGSIFAQGNSPAAVVSTMQGDMTLRSKAAQIRGIDLPALLQKRGEGWQQADEKTTDVQNLSVELKLQDGVATLRKSSMTLKDISLKPDGEIDFLRQAFDIQLNPRGDKLDRKLQLKGTWVQPRFAVDPGAAPALRPAAATPPPAN